MYKSKSVCQWYDFRHKITATNPEWLHDAETISSKFSEIEKKQLKLLRKVIMSRKVAENRFIFYMRTSQELYQKSGKISTRKISINSFLRSRYENGDRMDKNKVFFKAYSFLLYYFKTWYSFKNKILTFQERKRPSRVPWVKESIKT